jgi:formylglycine-generating enzyme required for sulfatase activity
MDWLIRSRVDAATIAGRLAGESDVSARRALIQVLADLGEEGRPPGGIPPALPELLASMSRDDPDPGVHSSVDYLLRRWGMTPVPCGPTGDRRWLVNAIGQTLAIVGPVESPGRRLAIATTETTVGQFQRFDPGYRARVERDYGAMPRDPEAAAGAVTYDEAARFCNWLSRQEGWPESEWCYVQDQATGHMALAPDYLTRRGYRLPTLREWEFAARAGTATDRYFGRTSRHMGPYAWYNRNSEGHAALVGRKRPNDLGLFDTLGNVDEWCYNPDPPHDNHCGCPADRGVDCRKGRLVSFRGGSYFHPEPCLVAVRYTAVLDFMDPGQEWNHIGFRVIRSVP